MRLLNFDINSENEIFKRIKRHTSRLRKERKFKELFRDLFVCFCFVYVKGMKERNEISRAEYFSYMLNFFKYYNMRMLNSN